MATVYGNGGRFNISTYNTAISGYVSWQETYDDATYSLTNKSTVTINVYLHRTNIYSGVTNLINVGGCRIAYFDSSEVRDDSNLNLEIAGNSSSSGGAYTHIYSASKEITHNDDGSKSITLGYYMTNYWDGGSASNAFKVDKTTQTVTLTKIPRYGTSYQSLKSKTSSSITMNWSSDNTVDYLWYSTNNGSNWTGVDVSDGTSGTYTIYNLSANTTYNIKTRIRRKDSQLTTDSSNLSVTTHPTTVASINFSSKTETSITVTSGCSVTASSTKYRIKQGSGSYGSWQTSNTFNNLSANTTYYIQVEKIGSASGEAGYAETSAITTYDYPYCTETPNFSLGNEVTLKFYNPLGRTFKFYIIGNGTQINVEYSCNSETYKGLNSLETTVPYLYATIPEKPSASYQVKVVYGSSTRIRNNGNTYSIKENNCKPKFSNFEYATDLFTLTGNYDTIVDGKTTTTFKISETNKASGTYSAFIKKYRIECGSQQVIVDFSESEIITNISNCKSSSLKVTAIDSRGLETTITKTVTNFKQYYKPSFASIETERKNGVDVETYLSAVMNFWNGNFGNGNNSIVVCEYRTKTKNSNTYSDWIPIELSKLTYDNDKVILDNLLIHANGTSGGFSVGVAYDLQLKVIDGFSNYYLELSESNAISITDGKVGFSLLKDGNGNYHMGIDGMPSLDSPLTISQKKLADLIYPVGSIYISINSTNPGTLFGGTWEQLKDRFLLGASSSYSAGNTGGATSVNSGNYSGTSGSYSGTSGSTSGTSGGPSTNTSGGPSNNTSGGPSNNTSGSTAISAAQMPSHNHQTYNTWGVKTGTSTLNYVAGVAADGFSGSANYTNYTGGGQGHTHTLSSHTHSLSSHTHSLSSHTHSMPSHTHSIPSHTHSIPSHNHSVSTMPPYLAVYMWKRTA